MVLSVFGFCITTVCYQPSYQPSNPLACLPISLPIPTSLPTHQWQLVLRSVAGWSADGAPPAVTPLSRRRSSRV